MELDSNLVGRYNKFMLELQAIQKEIASLNREIVEIGDHLYEKIPNIYNEDLCTGCSFYKDGKQYCYGIPCDLTKIHVRR